MRKLNMDIHDIRCIMLLQFLLIYTVSSTVSTAIYSITISLLLLVGIYEWYQTRKIVFTDAKFNIVYYSFFLLISLSSLVIGYKDSIDFALRFTQWSVITFLAVYISFQRHFHDDIIIKGIMLGVLTIAVISLYQFWREPLGMRIAGYFAHPNKASIIFMLNMPFLVIYLLWKKNSRAHKACLVSTIFVTCIVIAMTGSRGGIIGLCLGGFIFLLIQTFYIRKPSLHKVLIGWFSLFMISLCISSTYCFVFYHQQIDTYLTKMNIISITKENNLRNRNNVIVENNNLSTSKPKEQTGIERSYDNERILMWKSSWQMWKDHKVIGVGLKHWNEEYQKYYISKDAKEPTLAYPHNIYMTFFTMTGILGGIGVMLFTFGLLIYLCQLLKKYPDNIFLNALIWSSIAITLQGMVDIGILYRYAMILYSTYLGIGLASIACYQ